MTFYNNEWATDQREDYITIFALSIILNANNILDIH